MDFLKKSLFPAHLIQKVINLFITGTQSNHCSWGSPTTSPTFYFKLPHIGHSSVITQKKASPFNQELLQRCRYRTSFFSKIGNMLGVKEPIPGGALFKRGLHVRPVRPVTSTQRSGIFHACERPFSQDIHG